MKILIDTKNNTINIKNKTINLYSKDLLNTFQIYGLSLVGIKIFLYLYLARKTDHSSSRRYRKTARTYFQIKPTKVIETGIAHGGTAILFASILDQIKNKGKVIAIDVKIK